VDTLTVVGPDFVTAFVARYGDAWRSLDPARVLALCTEDTVWQVPGAGTPLRGREAVGAWLDALFAMVPDATFDYPVGPPLLALDGTVAGARFRLRGTMRGPMVPPGFAPTDGPIQDEGVEIYEEFRNGLLARRRRRDATRRPGQPA
jgi:hypothetical protein